MVEVQISTVVRRYTSLLRTLSLHQDPEYGHRANRYWGSNGRGLTSPYRITATSVPEGGAPFDSGTLTGSSRFRFVPRVPGARRDRDTIAVWQQRCVRSKARRGFSDSWGPEVLARVPCLDPSSALLRGLCVDVAVRAFHASAAARGALRICRRFGHRADNLERLLTSRHTNS